MSLLPAGGVANITTSVIPTTPGTVTNTVQDYFGQQVQTPVTVLPMGTPNLFPPSAEGAIAAAYIVQPGDTLSEIAQHYSTSVEAIAQANGIANPNLVFPGQRLSIPTG
jgi:LysM repeat protein